MRLAGNTSELNSAGNPAAVTQLLDMGVDDFLLTATVRGVLAQRLVRMNCPECSETVTDSATPSEAIEGITDTMRGRGCEKCSHTGYFGRKGIFELLILDDNIRGLISAKASDREIREAARAVGMRTMLEDGRMKVKEGLTTASELLRVTQEE